MELQEAQDAHREILSRREEVDKLTTSLRENVRQPNHLGPLIERALRSVR